MQEFTRSQCLEGLKKIFEKETNWTIVKDPEGESIETLDGDWYLFLIVSKDNPKDTSNGRSIQVNPMSGRFMSDENNERGYIERYYVQSGSVQVPGGGKNSEEVVFSKAFTATPHIVLTPHSGYPGDHIKGFSFNDPSNKGFTAVMNRTSDTTTSIHWMARGKIAGELSRG